MPGFRFLGKWLASVPRWQRRLRRLFAALVGLFAGLAGYWLAGQAWSDEQLMLVWLAFGLSITLLIILSLRLSRTKAMLHMESLQAAITAAGDERVPGFAETGSPAFDGLAQAIRRLVEGYQGSIAQLRRDRENFRFLAEDAVGIEAYFGPHGRLLWVNPGVEWVTGYTPQECLGCKDLIELWVYGKDQPMLRDLAQRALRGESRDDHELRLVHRNGTVTWHACRWHARRDLQGRVLGVRFSAQNIQRRKDAEFKLLETVAALRRAQALKEHYLNRSNEERQRLSSLLDILSLGILFADRDRRVVYINQPALDIWQLGSRDDVVGVRDEVLIERTQQLRRDDPAYRRHLDEVLATRTLSEAYDVELLDGRIINELSSVVLAPDGERVIGRVWIYEDVTEERRVAQRLTDLAERDPLTGLYNRRRFLEELDRQIADSARRHEQLGLLSFDLDGFKAVNDTFGHQAGDEVLMGLSAAISSVVRRNEMLFRLGGDEFALLVSSADEERMVQLAKRVLGRASELDFVFEGQPAHVTVSVGIALAPLHATERGELVAAADRAMYTAKMEGKNRWQVADQRGEEARWISET